MQEISGSIRAVPAGHSAQEILYLSVARWIGGSDLARGGTARAWWNR